MNEVIKNYNKLYAENDVTFGEGKSDSVVQDILKYKQSGTVLEIGAGEGRHSLFLAGKGFDVEALDSSDAGIAKLQEAAKKNGLKVETHVGDASSFQPEKKHDIVVVTFVLHHLPREQAMAVIQMMKENANPGGFNALAGFMKDGDFYRENPETNNLYFDTDEMKTLYADWEILDYSEKRGQAFQKREDGSPMFNITARILARKPV